MHARNTARLASAAHAPNALARSVVIPLPTDTSAATLSSMYAALGFVDRARIRRQDLAAATRRALALRALTDGAPSSLTLTDDDAEELLAECDAVYRAIDTRAVMDSAAAELLETFRVFRHAVDRACSAAPERMAA